MLKSLNYTYVAVLLLCFISIAKADKMLSKSNLCVKTTITYPDSWAQANLVTLGNDFYLFVNLKGEEEAANYPVKIEFSAIPDWKLVSPKSGVVDKKVSNEETEQGVVISLAGYSVEKVENTQSGNVYLVFVELLVDTDRDGGVKRKTDDKQEELWTEERGSIYTVNYDCDEKEKAGKGNKPDAIQFNDDGELLEGSEDFKINGNGDVEDLAPMKVLAMKGLPTFITVKEILEDEEFVKHNKEVVQNIIDEQVTVLKRANVTKFTKVPSLYISNGKASRNYRAFQPGCINFQQVDRKFYIPKQHSPIIAGEDLFEKEIKKKMVQLDSPLHFTDCWKAYHLGHGEVHCGSVVKRKIPEWKWWERINEKKE